MILDDVYNELLSQNLVANQIDFSENVLCKSKSYFSSYFRTRNLPPSIQILNIVELKLKNLSSGSEINSKSAKKLIRLTKQIKKFKIEIISV